MVRVGMIESVSVPKAGTVKTSEPSETSEKKEKKGKEKD